MRVVVFKANSCLQLKVQLRRGVAIDLRGPRSKMSKWGPSEVTYRVLPTGNLVQKVPRGLGALPQTFFKIVTWKKLF